MGKKVRILPTVYVLLIQFVVHLKLIQPCESTILQQKFFKKEEISSPRWGAGISWWWRRGNLRCGRGRVSSQKWNWELGTPKSFWTFLKSEAKPSPTLHLRDTAFWEEKKISMITSGVVALQMDAYSQDPALQPFLACTFIIAAQC